MTPPEPELHPLPVDLEAYRAALPASDADSSDPGVGAGMLARAIAAGPCAERFPGAVVVVREEPSPAVGLLARVPEAERSWLGAAIGTLSGTVERLRWVGWEEVEAAAEAAARALRRRVGEDRLRAAAVRGIPRGGRVAAGLVAYALDSPAAALERAPGAAPLTVVVDDCALSGARFREYVASLPDRPVVFVPLFSTAALRQAVEDAGGRVEACVGGRDLEDHAPARLGDDYTAWRRRWRDRSGERVYWIGQPDHLVFPWSEPEVAVWDEAREDEAPGLAVAPPELCLDRRAAGRERLEIRRQPRGPGPLRPTPHLLWGRLDDRVVIRDTAADRALTLRGTAAEMWEAVVREGRPDAAARRVARGYDTARERVEADLRELVGGLEERGALVSEEPAPRRRGAAPAGRSDP